MRQIWIHKEISRIQIARTSAWTIHRDRIAADS
jgi:hypothetical protein